MPWQTSGELRGPELAVSDPNYIIAEFEFTALRRIFLRPTADELGRDSLKWRRTKWPHFKGETREGKRKHKENLGDIKEP